MQLKYQLNKNFLHLNFYFQNTWHRKDIFTIVKSFETVKVKYAKILFDIKFIRTCKQEHIISTFTNVKLSIKGKNIKLKHHIAQIIMDGEMMYKHQQKEKLKINIKRLSIQLKLVLHVMIYSLLQHKVNLAIKSKSKVIGIHHSKKLLKFQQSQKQQKKTINNFSLYNFSKDEYDALSCGLYQHILGNVTYNKINTEFELFYQNIVRDISHLPEHNIDRRKTKLWSVVI